MTTASCVQIPCLQARIKTFTCQKLISCPSKAQIKLLQALLTNKEFEHIKQSFMTLHASKAHICFSSLVSYEFERTQQPFLFSKLSKLNQCFYGLLQLVNYEFGRTKLSLMIQNPNYIYLLRRIHRENLKLNLFLSDLSQQNSISVCNSLFGISCVFNAISEAKLQ